MITALLAASILALMALSAFFSSAETVLFSLAPVQLNRLRERRPATAESLQRKLDDPARTLSAILAGNTLVNFAIAALGYRLVSMYVQRGAAGATPNGSRRRTTRRSTSSYSSCPRPAA